MAERCIPTAKLYESVSKLLKGDAPDTLSHLGLSVASMASLTEDSSDLPSETGITREAVTPTLDTTTKTNDTVVCAKTAWEPGAYTVYGAGIFTHVSNSTVLQAFHEWAASVTFEAGDTVDQTIKIQSKQGS